MKIFRTILYSILIAAVACAWGLPATQAVAAPPTSPIELGVLTSGVEAPLAATGKLIFNNKTGVVIPQLILTGVKNYTFYNVPAGKSEFTVEKGKYSVEYPACGKSKIKKVSISGNTKINTVSCPTTTVNLINQTGGTFYLTLTGPATYRFNIPTGTTKITVMKGQYSYYVSGNCGTSSGTVKIRNRMRWTWWCY